MTQTSDRLYGEDGSSSDDRSGEGIDNDHASDIEDSDRPMTKRKGGLGYISKEREEAVEKIQGRMAVLRKGREELGLNSDFPATFFGGRATELINFMPDPVYKMTTGYIQITWCLRCWTLHYRDHFNKAFRSLKFLEGDRCPLILQLRRPFLGTRGTPILTTEQVQKILMAFFSANHDHIIKEQPDVFTYDDDGWIIDFKGPNIQLAGKKSELHKCQYLARHSGVAMNAQKASST